MHLYVRKMPGEHKNGGPNWGLIWAVWKNGKLKQERVPKHRYLELGFPPSLTLDEAKSRSEALNAQETLKTRALKREAIAKRLDEEKLIETAFLSNADVEEFESKILLQRLTPTQAKAKKLLSHWRACKRAINVVQLEISEWSKKPFKFYDYWAQQPCALSYVKKLIPILNQWGEFQSEKYDKRFKSLPFPTGDEASKIADAYFDKFHRNNESDPLTPALLESKKGNFSEKQYNWLLISTWFGLRPAEVELLKKPSAKYTWHIDTNKNGIQLLFVYQSKLTKLARDKRIKHIPCFYPEQLACLEIIKTGNFEKPLVKTVRKYFTDYTTCYGGRKGFENMMLAKGHAFQDVSKWLGHRNINMSYSVYLDHQKVDDYKKAS